MDPIVDRILALREEEPGVLRAYNREAWYRQEANLPQVEPHVWFQAPPKWPVPKAQADTFKSLALGDQPVQALKNVLLEDNNEEDEDGA